MSTRMLMKNLDSPMFTAALLTITKGRSNQSVRRQVNGQQEEVHTYSGIFFGHYKEGNSDTCYNRDEP